MAENRDVLAAQEELKALRGAFDHIDAQLTALLEERFNLSKRMVAVKAVLSMPTQDLGREEAILEGIKGRAKDPQNGHYLVEIYEAILAQSRAIQENLEDSK